MLGAPEAGDHGQGARSLLWRIYAAQNYDIQAPSRAISQQDR